MVANAVFGQGKPELRGPDYPRIARCYGARVHNGAKKESLDFVSKSDLIIGGVQVDADKEFKYIKQKNPDIIILNYISVRGRRPTDRRMKPEWWLNDTQGKPVHPWPGVNLLNETNPELNKYLIHLADRVLKRQLLMDGIFLDSFGAYISYMNKGDLDANGDGKRDDKEWLNEEWKKGVLRVAEGIGKLRDGKVIVMANGWNPLRFAFEYLNGCLLEDTIVRVTQGRAKWQVIMDGYLRWFGVPRQPHVTAIVSGGGSVEDPWKWRKMSRAERDAEAQRARENYQCMRLGLCATLMGDGYYAYDYSTTSRGQGWWYKEYDAPLGYPAGDAKKMPDGTWQRRYDGGLVVVNPTKKEVSVHLDRAYVDMSTEKTVSSVTLAAQDGRILIAKEK